MADLTSSDVTVTVLEQGRRQSGDKVNLCSIAFGDGVDTYPSGGVPLPSAASFGMSEVLKYLVVVDDDVDQGIVWKYDYTNKKLKAYILGLDIDAAGSDTLDDFPIDATAEPLATGSLSVGLADSGAAAGVVYLGRLKELAAASSAPAATTLIVEAVGW